MFYFVKVKPDESMLEFIILSMQNSQPLLRRAAWYAFKIFASLRLLTLLWVLLFASASDRTIAEPDVLCKTRSLSENSSDTVELLNSAIRWDTVCYLLIAESGYTIQAGLTGWPPFYPICLLYLQPLVMQ